MRPPGFRIPPYGVGVADNAATIRRLNERAWLVAEVRRGITALHAQGALREGLAPDRYAAWLFRLGCTELLGAPPAVAPPATP